MSTNDADFQIYSLSIYNYFSFLNYSNYTYVFSLKLLVTVDESILVQNESYCEHLPILTVVPR